MFVVSLQRPLTGLAAALLLLGCGSSPTAEDKNTQIDSGADAIQPSDLAQTDSPDLKGDHNIGKPCDPTNESNPGCGDDAVCLALNATIGICALDGCTLEDLETPAREDNCPEETACSSVPVKSDTNEQVLHNFCLSVCVPDVARNSCEAVNPEIACSPISVLTNGHTEVCLFPACSEDKHCGKGNELNPEMRCDKPTGLCFNLGTEEGSIGDPCTVGNDCGPDQFCFTESIVDGKKRVAGGYCTIVGCIFEGPWSCPEHSACFGLGSGEALTMCLKTGCDPVTNVGCREEAPEGQYDCIEFKDSEKEGVCWLDLTD